MNEEEYLKSILTYNPISGDISRKGKSIGYINKKGYKCIYLHRKEYKAHRIAWLLHYGCFPDGEIDHKDGDRCNNSINNLRTASRFDNMNNLTCHRVGEYPGIKKRWNKYAAYVTINKVQYYIGLFNTVGEAVNHRSEYILNFVK